jgi:hypothetical protein
MLNPCFGPPATSHVTIVTSTRAIRAARPSLTDSSDHVAFLIGILALASFIAGPLLGLALDSDEPQPPARWRPPEPHW